MAKRKSTKGQNNDQQNIHIKQPIVNISAISWRSVLLVEETGEPAENH
jgi:hypothetical protein